MCDKNFKVLCSIILIVSALSVVAVRSAMPSETARTEENQTVSAADNVTVEDDAERQNQETRISSETEEQNIEAASKDNAGDGVSPDEVEIVNAAEFGNPKEVLDDLVITSNVDVKKTETDELQIEFEIERVGRCTFAASKGKELVLPDEVFVDSTKVEWTAPTADGEYIFPYMKVNETGDMFIIDWMYDEYNFAIYGKSPQNTSDRDMAGKIALAIIRNLGGEE